MRYRKEAFIEALGGTDWARYENIEDPNLLWDMFLGNITSVLDQTCPIRVLNVVSSKPKWLTNTILRKMRARDKAYKRARRSGLLEDWNRAKELRNALGMDIRRSKANVIKTELDNNRSNPRKFWEEINKLLPNSRLAEIHTLYDEDNEIVTGPSLNNFINNYFANIGSSLAAGCTPGGIGEPNHLRMLPEYDYNKMALTEEEVIKVCKTIDITKSSSVPNIASRVLKDAFLANITRVTKLFNCSIRMSIFPDQWKLSSIVPLPKITNPTNASDLRPVALTPLPGKLLEKLICKRLQNWLEINNILTETQHGFRKGRSTISAIVSLLNDIYLYININNNKNPSIIFLDLKKAFDTVSHEKLIGKLHLLGLDIEIINWFKSYLGGRRQCVVLNNKTSTVLPITYGVPQGSILGPILFSLYINEIPSKINCGIVLYADDTVIYHDDVNVLQHNLTLFSDWCDDNLLTINVKKSQWMQLKVHKIDDRYQRGFKIKDQSLEEVKVYKYLGIHLDNQLNFQQHHKLLTRNINLKVAHFKRIRNLVTVEAATLIYKCTILPAIEYADFILDQGIAYINKSLQKIQNLCLLIIYNQHVIKFDQRDSTEVLHRRAGIFRLIHRRRLHLLQYAHTLRLKESIVDDRNIMTRRRNRIVFKVVHSNHYKFYKNPLYRCAIEWNSMEVNLSLIVDRNEFNRNLKNLIVDPYTKIL